MAEQQINDKLLMHVVHVIGCSLLLTVRQLICDSSALKNDVDDWPVQYSLFQI